MLAYVDQNHEPNLTYVRLEPFDLKNQADSCVFFLRKHDCLFLRMHKIVYVLNRKEKFPGIKNLFRDMIVDTCIKIYHEKGSGTYGGNFNSNFIRNADECSGRI